jgi:hypothetical protein
VRLERRLERRSRDAAGIARDCGRGDDGDDLESEVLAETGGDKAIAVLVL